ncbi:hypothetical protein PG990_014005 [Apiospora arundinis]|uniref:Uncharacterized protein n=1 Tax=Apiospora arundinis TaxID=335852 RepID=A0ABR2IA14_9PEZI
MSSIPAPVSPKEKVLEKVASLQGVGVKNGIEKSWDENTAKMLYRENLQPPVSQAHADCLMAEEKWYEACFNRDYPWHGSAETYETSEPWFTDYFVYWLERKRLVEATASLDDLSESEDNPIASITDPHAAAWQKVISQKKALPAKTTKKELREALHESHQRMKALFDLLGQQKKTTALEKGQHAHELSMEKRKYRAKLDHEKRKYKGKQAKEKNLDLAVNMDQQEQVNELRSKLQSLGYSAYASLPRGNGTQRVAVDDQQQAIQANYLQDLDAKDDKNADNTPSNIEKLHNLNVKLGLADAKIPAQEKENDQLREKAGEGVEVKKKEKIPWWESDDDIQPVKVNKEGGYGKRKFEEMGSEV